jgi:hypothetical protein
MLERRLFLLAVAPFLASMAEAGGAGPAFVMTSIALYLPNKAMVQRGPSVEDLSNYIRALVSKADSVLSAHGPTPGASGALVVALKPPARSRLWVMVGDEAREGEFTTALQAPLEAVPPPSVTGVNAFAINFDAWGGGQPLRSHPLPVPDQWIQALPKKGGILPDAPLSVLWPD